MDGFLNIRKSTGMTSYDVIRRLKKMMPGSRLGHLGTLDPMAAGVLPVAAEAATRVIEYAADTDKVYRATMTLGGVSDTQDAWGHIEYQPVADFDQDRLMSLLDDFTGTMMQIPPMHSAVHHRGRRLYELARQGITVEREARRITIYSISMLGCGRDAAGRPTIEIEVHCSQGTYIRTLCHDIGAGLGTGAFMSALLRIRAGAFTIDRAVPLEQIAEGSADWTTWLCPVDFPLQHLPRVDLDETDIGRIRHGNQIEVSYTGPAGIIRVYGPGQDLAAIGRYSRRGDKQMLQPLKVLKR